MDRQRAGHRSLRRIASMLVAMAAVAECAAGRSLAVRWLVLCILRWAVHVARVAVIEETRCEWEWPAAFPGDPSDRGFAPADALLLAASFRQLAAILVSLLPAEPASPRSRRAGRRRAPFAPRPPRFAPAGPGIVAPDTS